MTLAHEARADSHDRTERPQKNSCQSGVGQYLRVERMRRRDGGAQQPSRQHADTRTRTDTGTDASADTVADTRADTRADTSAHTKPSAVTHTGPKPCSHTGSCARACSRAHTGTGTGTSTSTSTSSIGVAGMDGQRGR